MLARSDRNSHRIDMMPRGDLACIVCIHIESPLKDLSVSTLDRSISIADRMVVLETRRQQGFAYFGQSRKGDEPLRVFIRCRRWCV